MIRKNIITIIISETKVVKMQKILDFKFSLKEIMKNSYDAIVDKGNKYKWKVEIRL